MMFGASGLSNVAASGGTFDGYDDFTGSTLSTEKWGTYNPHPAETELSVDGRLHLGIIASTYDTVAVRSVTPVVTSGTLEIEFKWTPGYFDTNGGSTAPYVAVTPASPTRNTPLYNNAYGYPAVVLGRAGVTQGSTRTRISIGTPNAAMTSITGSYYEASFSEGTEYTIKFVINWTTSEMALYVNGGEPVLSGVTLSYTPTVAHYLEIAYSGKSITDQTCIDLFDDVAFTS